MCKYPHLKRQNESQPRRKRAICKQRHKNSKTRRGLMRRLQKRDTRSRPRNLCVRPQSSDECMENVDYSKITPEMLVESIRELSFWRDPVEFHHILKYIKDRFPVNPDLKQLEHELRQKLRVAEKAGIVRGDTSDRWRLSTGLERLRQVPETLLTLFWQLHCDTINPLAGKRKRKHVYKIEIQKQEDTDSDTLPSDE